MLLIELMINSVGHTKSRGPFTYPCPTPHTKDKESIVAHSDETTNDTKRTIQIYHYDIFVLFFHRCKTIA
jgi:hypothetical protein